MTTRYNNSEYEIDSGRLQRKYRQSWVKSWWLENGALLVKNANPIKFDVTLIFQHLEVNMKNVYRPFAHIALSSICVRFIYALEIVVLTKHVVIFSWYSNNWDRTFIAAPITASAFYFWFDLHYTGLCEKRCSTFEMLVCFSCFWVYSGFPLPFSANTKGGHTVLNCSD